ncbi:hypothetical protein PV797_07985 [Clostridiaceae bacterium M8S5]|nr:hypothetical protein PV797_07985 [Clostridiaceae bacterium M8S5]
MNKQTKKLIINTSILAIIILMLYLRSGLYISPIKAHEDSERGLHYGPSKIVHSRDFKDGKYYLCKYDKWISVDEILKSKLFFWRAGSPSFGLENKKDKSVVFSWSRHDSRRIVYGAINDARIKKIEVHLTDGTTLTETKFYDNLFLINWEAVNMKKIIARDSSDNIIYESEY